jgi:hypothetical protein
MPFGQSVVWPAAERSAAKPWLWNERTDMLWIAGGASLLFAVAAVPASYLWVGFGPALITAFLHLGSLVNYPHYMATYELAVRERAKRPRNFWWLVGTTPVMLALASATVLWPERLLIPLVRVYLTWSAYHYASQHFGIASMYAARQGRPLTPLEKVPLRASFVGIAIYMMISLNMMTAETVYGATPGFQQIDAILPRAIYPAALVVLVASLAAFALANHRLRLRTARGFDLAVWTLALANFVWFVIPNVWLPGSQAPWLGARLAIWVPIATPFFHCAQYLGVAADRARADQPVRPVRWLALLVAAGLLSFEGTVWVLPRVVAITPSQALLVVVSILNIHHFVIDGIIWKQPKRAPRSIQGTVHGGSGQLLVAPSR